jgi:hypothetical protein
MNKPPRVYADFNGLHMTGTAPEIWRVALDTQGTLRHLAKLRLVLKPGMHLTIFDQSDENEDLEADATVVYEDVTECWMAEVDSKGYRYVPSLRTVVPAELQCANCGEPLDGVVEKAGGLSKASCPVCGTRATAPLCRPT